MVDVALIKKLRALTHAPLKDCKSALEESNGDLDRAQEILREKGALKASKKADRETNEGTVAMKTANGKNVGLILASETDFVAKNPTFLGLASEIADQFSLLEGELTSFDTFSDEAKADADKVLKDNFVTIGENMRIVNAFSLSGNAYIYRHPGDKVAAIVFYEGDEAVAKSVALQVAAMNPQYLSVDDVDAAEVEKLKAQFAEEMADSGKPADIVERIIEGKLQKAWSEIVLLEQTSIVDDSKKIKQLLGETTVSRYIRYAV